MKDIMTIGDKVCFLRKKLHLTQKKLSIMAGISNTYLCDIEKGRVMPSLKTLFKLAKALEIDAPYLLQATNQNCNFD